MSSLDPAIAVQRLPRHLAIVMDGNGRWAEARHQPRTFGHRAGVRAVRAVVEACLRRSIPALTLFAFSSENWKRPKTEVNALMKLFMLAMDKEVDSLQQNGVRLSFIGDVQGFEAELGARMQQAEARTQGNTRLRLNVAANYGGRWDITAAARTLARQAAAGDLDPEAITEQHIQAAVALADLPEPDLFIRTGGEQRISNFLLWQLAYAELWFTETLWPDFDADCLDQALSAFTRRERRFGRTGAQTRKPA
jgi:undecaprenyl diphosphate synthase